MNRRSLLGSTLLALTALPLRWPRSIRTALADFPTVWWWEAAKAG
jgi:hypothetical protein